MEKNCIPPPSAGDKKVENIIVNEMKTNLSCIYVSAILSVCLFTLRLHTENGFSQSYTVITFSFLFIMFK